MKENRAYLYRRIVQAKLFIDANYNKHIDLDQVAGEALFSKFHFIRLFKSVYGRTPHQYLTVVRIEHAKRELRLDRAVSDVCYSVGFDSESSFTALFRKHVGSNPSDFRRTQVEYRTSLARTPLLGVPNCFAEKFGWTQNRNFQELTA